MRKLVSVLVFFLLLGSFAEGICAAEVKIAVIDLQAVVRKSEAGQEALKKLQEKFNVLKEKLQAQEEKLRKFKQDLEKKAPLLSEEARREKEREYQKMLREYQAAREDAQFEMKQEEEKALKPIMKDLEQVVKNLAEKDGYDLILEKRMPGLYWASDKIDITDKVVELYNKYRASKKK